MNLFTNFTAKSLIIGLLIQSMVAFGSDQTGVDWYAALEKAKNQISEAAANKYGPAEVSIDKFSSSIESTTTESFELSFSFRINIEGKDSYLSCVQKKTILTAEGIENPEEMIKKCYDSSHIEKSMYLPEFY